MNLAVQVPDMPHADSALISEDVKTKEAFYASVNESLEALLAGPAKQNWVGSTVLGEFVLPLSQSVISERFPRWRMRLRCCITLMLHFTTSLWTKPIGPASVRSA